MPAGGGVGGADGGADGGAPFTTTASAASHIRGGGGVLPSEVREREKLWERRRRERSFGESLMRGAERERS
jgi:hypothetical protein